MMSEIRVVTARLGHVLRVARRLDPELVLKLGERGLDARVLLRTAFEESREAWALLVGGKAVAVGGWKGTLLGGRGEAWLSIAPEAREHPIALARATAVQARRLHERGMTIGASVLADNERDRQFAMWCGLMPAGAAKDGMQYFEMVPFTPPPAPPSGFQMLLAAYGYR